MDSNELKSKKAISVEEFIGACKSKSFSDEEIARMIFSVKCTTLEEGRKKATVLRECRHNAQLIYSRMLQGLQA